MCGFSCCGGEILKPSVVVVVVAGVMVGTYVVVVVFAKNGKLSTLFWVKMVRMGHFWS